MRNTNGRKEGEHKKHYLLEFCVFLAGGIAFLRSQVIITMGQEWIQQFPIVMTTATMTLEQRQQQEEEQQKQQQELNWSALPSYCQNEWNFSVSSEQLMATFDINATRKLYCKRCQCPHPLSPIKRDSKDRSFPAYAVNEELSTNATLDNDKRIPLDVVFLGDSITEGMNGWYFGNIQGVNHTVQEQFQRNFPNGLALGMCGDMTNHLLYRIESSRELPLVGQPSPKVWWITIGINNIKGGKCPREATLVSIHKVVQKLQDRILTSSSNATSKTKSPTIVLNSILPFRRTVKPSLNGLWAKSVSWVNHQMECMSYQLPHVEFFNATEYFLLEDGETVNREWLGDFLHPTYLGYGRWQKGVLERLSQILVAYDEE